MAEIQYGELGVGTPGLSKSNLKWIINWLGGLVSVTLIAGLVFWGYQLMIRDVTGVPVVRALEGPMRITPVEPGGASAEHQGLAVNNIAAVGQAEAPADRLVLAPKPTALGANDPTAAELEQTSPVIKATDAALIVASSETANEPKLVAPETLDQAALIEATLRLVDGAGPTDPVSATPADDLVLASVAGVSSSLRPVMRPPTLSAVQTVATPAATLDDVKSIASADIPAGTRLAQLGAFETADIAKQQWLQISDRFEEFMAGKSRVIEQAQSGGKVFYRLRAHGFTDLSDARRFCSTLLAAQANCIPVVTR